ncbi:MAG: hypothetical protein DMG41_29245 [Acidobacteria bacterium]|nr:MAG: hypothetical protein DMG41_29245 [Acidobacteriota bacterium]
MSSDGGAGDHQVPEESVPSARRNRAPVFLRLLGIFGHGKQTSRIFVFLPLASRSPFKHQAVPEGGGSMFVCPARSLYPNLSQ